MHLFLLYPDPGILRHYYLTSVREVGPTGTSTNRSCWSWPPTSPWRMLLLLREAKLIAATPTVSSYCSWEKSSQKPVLLKQNKIKPTKKSKFNTQAVMSCLAHKGILRCWQEFFSPWDNPTEQREVHQEHPAARESISLTTFYATLVQQQGRKNISFFFFFILQGDFYWSFNTRTQSSHSCHQEKVLAPRKEDETHWDGFGEVAHDERDRIAVTPAKDLGPLLCPGRGGHGPSAPDQRDSGSQEGWCPSLQHQEIPKPGLAWEDPLQRIWEGWHSVGQGRLIPFLEQLPPSAAGGKSRTQTLQQGCPSHWPSHPAGPLLLLGGKPGCRQLCVLQSTAKLIYIKNKEHTIPKCLGFVY